MAAPVLSITDGADVVIDSGNPLVTADAPPGATTPVGIIRVHNAPAVDDAVGYGLLALAKLTATGAEFLQSGIEVLDIHALRTSISPLSPHGAPTSPLGLGEGTVQALPDIPSGSFVELDVELKLPAGVSVSGVTFTLNIERVVSAFIGGDPGNGIVTLLGDGSASYVADADDVVKAASPNDDTVLLPNSTIVAQGVPIFETAEALVFDDQDGSAQTLTPGDSYAALISYDASGRTVTKGDKSAGAPTVPATPTGHLARAVVIVPEGLLIADVTPLIANEGNFLGTFAGFDLIVSGGFANVGEYRVTPQTAVTVSLSAFPSASTDVYVTLNAEFILSPFGTPPTGRPLPLWRAITDGVGITSIEDLRVFAGPGYS